MSAARSLRAKLPITKVENETNQVIGERLRRARLLRGMSLANVADALGVCVQSIHKYETATASITPGKLKMLAQIFGVPITHLFDARDSEEIDPRPFGRRLMSLMRRLPEIEREEPNRFFAICRMAGIQTPKCRF